MDRLMITNEVGTWIDTEKAERWEEQLYWENGIKKSVATGDQWRHEMLLCVESGRFFVFAWCALDGSDETCASIDDDCALDWIFRNGHAVPLWLGNLVAGSEIS